MSDLTLGNIFCPAPKDMIRLSVEYRQDSKIPIRLWKSLVGDTPKNKESVVKPDVKPAAVMNHSTLEGVIHFYDHKMATAWTVLKSLE